MPRLALLRLLGLCVALLLTQAALAQDQTDPGQPVTHVVQPGDNLYRIALRYGTTTTAIAQANNITNAERIYVGQRLTIPGLTVPDSSSEVVNPLIAGTPVIHTVQPGENLTLIAQKYNVSVEQIMRANGITNANRLERGQRLQVWVTEPDTADIPGGDLPLAEQPPTAQPASAPLHQHTVRSGETLGTIARRYGVPWYDIAQANNIANVNLVYAGQVLVIPGVAATSSPAARQAGTRAEDLGILSAPANAMVPTPTVTNGKQIIVVLRDQMVYAFENGELVYSVLASTGLPATPTVQGDYRIYHRLASQTMSGPGYYLPGVTWVQYFYAGYAFHTAYWHENWGTPMSRGCVNLPEQAARWLYDFASIGTPVRVVY